MAKKDLAQMWRRLYGLIDRYGEGRVVRAVDLLIKLEESGENMKAIQAIMADLKPLAVFGYPYDPNTSLVFSQQLQRTYGQTLGTGGICRALRYMSGWLADIEQKKGVRVSQWTLAINKFMQYQVQYERGKKGSAAPPKNTKPPQQKQQQKQRHEPPVDRKTAAAAKECILDDIKNILGGKHAT